MPIKEPIKMTVYELIDKNFNSDYLLFGGWKEEDDLENNRLENLTLDFFTPKEPKKVKRKEVENGILKTYRECRDDLIEEEKEEFDEMDKDGEITDDNIDEEVEKTWNAMNRLQKSYLLTDWNIKNSKIRVYSVREAQNYLNNPDLRMEFGQVIGTPFETKMAGQINEQLKQVYERHNSEPNKVM